jgi:hypothetical protein
VNTRTGWYSKAVSEATTGGAYDRSDDDPTWGGAPIAFPRIQGADVWAASWPWATASMTPDRQARDHRQLAARLVRSDNKDKTGYFGSELRRRLRGIHHACRRAMRWP